jgi:hypothetical protein
MSRQDVIFVSRDCEWCKQAIALVSPKDANRYLMVDVANAPNLPKCVDRVPTLLSHEKKLYQDDALFDYLRARNEVNPFMIKEMSGLSDCYSYLGDDTNTNGMSHAYNFLSEGDSTIPTPTDEDKERIVNYDQFIAQRDNDLSSILQSSSNTAHGGQKCISGDVQRQVD